MKQKYEHGAIKKIAEECGCSKVTVWNVLTKGTNDLKQIKKHAEKYKLKESRIQPLDRYDIYNNLPHGALTAIARNCGCSLPTVIGVLNAQRPDHHGIIKAAELMAAINIWKTRFCKHKSQL